MTTLVISSMNNVPLLFILQIGKKPRSNVLNTYSVMVKNKETDAVPSATVTLDDDKGLSAIQEGKERESQLVDEEITNDITLQKGQEEASSKQEEEKKLSVGNDDRLENDRPLSTGDQMDKENDTVNTDNAVRLNQNTDIESIVQSIEDNDKLAGDEHMSSNNDNTESVDSTSGERKSTEYGTQNHRKEKIEHDTNDTDELNKLNDGVAERKLLSKSENNTNETHLNVDLNVNEQTLSDNSEPNTITDKDTGITISQESDLDKHV